MQDFNVDQEVEWLTHPTGDGGYLRGIVMQVGLAKVKIQVQSPKTGKWKVKYADPRYLRAVVKKDCDICDAPLLDSICPVCQVERLCSQCSLRYPDYQIGFLCCCTCHSLLKNTGMSIEQIGADREAGILTGFNKA